MKYLGKTSVAVFIFLIFMLLYVAFKLSPSSYAIVLKNDFHAENTGLILGDPRGIRSDEWAI